MSETILLCTACLEFGLAAGYGLCRLEQWLRDSRGMVAGFAGAMGTRTNEGNNDVRTTGAVASS